MSDELFTGEDQTIPLQRTTFLTVLCVLTFLGSAYGIFGGVQSYLNADTIVAEMKKGLHEGDKEKNREKMEKAKGEKGARFAFKMLDSMKNITAQDFRNTGMGAIAANILTLLGALLMWRLSRIGFYLYVAGVIASVAIPYLIFGSENFIFVFNAIFTGFFGVIFIAMYAFNLQDMK